MYIAAKILLISLFTVQAKSQGCISPDILNISSFCTSYTGPVYNYTTLDQFQQIITDLTSAFANLTFDITDLCYPSVQTYMCDYFFPPCVSDTPRAICKDSCDNYLHSGVCTGLFTDLLSYLTSINSTIIPLFNTNCSASLQPLYGIETREFVCNRLNGIPYKNGSVECSPVPPTDVFCRTTFRYSHFSAAITSQINIHIQRISSLSSNASITQECTNFFAFYQCIGSYTPCNETSMKVFTFCEDTCDIINSLVLKCFDFTKIDPALLQYFAQFNCSNPLTFSSSLTLDYYESPDDEMCSALRQYFGESSETNNASSSGGLTGGEIAAIIICTLLAVVIILITIIVITTILFRRNKSSISIVLRKDGMFTANPQYDLTLKKTNHVMNKDDSTIHNDDVVSPSTEVSYLDNMENMIAAYQEQLAPLLIKPSDFVMGEEIGQGAFGKVYKGIFYSSDNDFVVAIKTMKTSDWSSEDMKSFLLECSKMSELNHPNVLGLVGISIEDDSPYMLLPYMVNGDLKQFLLSRRVSEEDVTVYPEDLNENILLGMILDIAKGMEYLATLHFIHRDLAARNCMVDDNLQVKIADFGLSRDVYESNYYVLRHSAKLPVRWMALESLLDGCFNLKSDVWSYGVTCWEIFSLGRQPYPGISHAEISEYLSSGHRLAKPHLCPTSLYTLITSCWEVKSNDRPTFEELVAKIDWFKQLKTNIEKTDSDTYITSTITT